MSTVLAHHGARATARHGLPALAAILLSVTFAVSNLRAAGHVIFDVAGYFTPGE